MRRLGRQLEDEKRCRALVGRGNYGLARRCRYPRAKDSPDLCHGHKHRAERGAKVATCVLPGERGGGPREPVS